ncbi:MBG domain-containing protein [Mangrovibacterium diazotrophicum]|uniref:Putative secreted protein (Por secretion system target) n=1 Tax=Mangrovibacterium diazotrophicum TaxID=1261403 RepID=A0A419VUL9_9BACT|nr:MBG domain-containing protein [Mangrovibacterium diazotrophicum]RKD85043.1 putative secreted protein (Por secretion system target) [Mangrovibacterium diazotrophicum]
MKAKILPRKTAWKLLMLIAYVAMLAPTGFAQEVTIFTDKDDYYPGEWVVITGSGWENDESVLINLTHIEPNIPDHTHDPWYLYPDANGEIYDEWFVFDDELGTTFWLTATGTTTGLFAETTFTDGSEPKINSITPLSGVAGDDITIVLNQPATSISSVLFGLDYGTNISLDVDGKTITVTVPNGSGLVYVTVNGYWDNKGTSTYFTDTFKDQFNIGCSSPTVNTDPTNQTITYGSDATFTITASGTAPLGYQWQVDEGSGYINIVNGGVYSGATSPTLTITGPTVAMSSYQYQCVVTGQCNPTATSAAATLTVNPKALEVIADNQSKTYGSAFTFLGTEFTTVGLVNSDAVTSATITSDGAPATATVAGSTYDINISAAVGSGLGNYTITYTKGAFTVNPKALEVIADNQTKTYGSAFTFAGTEFTTVGLVNSDAVTSATITSDGAPATATVAGSTYDINISAAVGSGLGNYSITYTKGAFTVNPYQICALYNGSLFVTQDGSSPAVFTVSIDVQANDLVGSMNPDDVIVTFNIKPDDNQADAESSSSVQRSELHNGLYTYSQDWSIDLDDIEGSPLEITWELSGNYTLGDCDEVMAIGAVARPTDNFVTGGGYYYPDPANTGGSIGADETSRVNFGLAAKMTTKGKNQKVTGGVNIIWRKGGEKWQAKSNSASLPFLIYELTDEEGVYRAEVLYTSANVRQLETNNAGGAEGSGTIAISVVDRSEPGSNGTPDGGPDEIGIVIKDSKGNLLVSYYTTPDQANTLEFLDGGNIQVHTGSKNKSAEITSSLISTVESPTLTVYPNPFSDRLRFEFASPETVDARIDLYDMNGRLVKTVFEGTIEGNVMNQADFIPAEQVSGTYLYHCTIGNETFTGKVIFKR